MIQATKYTKSYEVNRKTSKIVPADRAFFIEKSNYLNVRRNLSLIFGFENRLTPPGTIYAGSSGISKKTKQRYFTFNR